MKLEHIPLALASIPAFLMLIVRSVKDRIPKDDYTTTTLGLALLMIIQLWLYSYMRLNRHIRETH